MIMTMISRNTITPIAIHRAMSGDPEGPGGERVVPARLLVPPVKGEFVVVDPFIVIGDVVMFLLSAIVGMVVIVEMVVLCAWENGGGRRGERGREGGMMYEGNFSVVDFEAFFFPLWTPRCSSGHAWKREGSGLGLNLLEAPNNVLKW